MGGGELGYFLNFRRDLWLLKGSFSVQIELFEVYSHFVRREKDKIEGTKCHFSQRNRVSPPKSSSTSSGLR